MSYYEDLGVAPNASPEQIREAYKILVRLLHPDQQTDPALKRAAEGQMRRVNRAYSVLSDPALRHQYETELHRVPEKPAPPLVIRTPNPVVVRTQLQAGPLLWVGAALLSLGVIFWLATEGQMRQNQNKTTRVSTSAEPEPIQKPVERPAAETQPPKTAPSPEPPTVQPPQRVPGAEPTSPTPTTTLPAVEQAAITAPQMPAPEPPHVAQTRFGGFWAYPQNKIYQHQSGQYPPQYIEATITEKDGAIHGKYRSRYYVSDRPISPNVNFEFEGTPDGGSAKLPWHGEGGSQGTLEIKLLSGDELQVIWHATDFGQILGLASGTAVLMRRPD